jgi:hypothetical protein
MEHNKLAALVLWGGFLLFLGVLISFRVFYYVPPNQVAFIYSLFLDSKYVTCEPGFHAKDPFKEIKLYKTVIPDIIEIDTISSTGKVLKYEVEYFAVMIDPERLLFYGQDQNYIFRVLEQQVAKKVLDMCLKADTLTWEHLKLINMKEYNFDIQFLLLTSYSKGG